MHTTFGATFLAVAYGLALFIENAASASLQGEPILIPHVVARQAPTGTSSESLPATTISPTTSPTGASVNISVATSIVNKPLPTITVFDSSSNSHQASGSIDLSCANCSTFGTLGFTADDFSYDNGTITGGIIEMEANGFGGIFEVGITSADLARYTFSHLFFSYPIVGIGLPGIPGANAGISLEIGGDFDIELDDSIEFTFGGSFTVPDGAIITFDTTDLGNSSQHGFTPSTGLQLSPVPFQANLSSPTLTASLAIQPRLILGIHAEAVYAEAGIDFDLPRLSVEVTRLTNVDVNCNTINNTNHATAVPGNATNVIPSAEVDIGLLADAGAFDIKNATSTQLASAMMTLPTACLLFDSAAHSLEPATSATTSSGTIGGKKGNGAAGSFDVHVWGMMWVLGFSMLCGMIMI
ncbi:MAG: hypothetical protein M1821_005936 [Bathelium mastoideum]|nr:MAG: hypothetical protein M1821_005936 [Bathelium mastoideum]KAI9688524.1 MAG: hypothetical protein M1822_001473 [Bathelium mastoideum]